MKIGHIEIFVKDPVKSKDFYSDVLGFEVEDIQKNSYVWLKSGDVLILLRPAGEKSTSTAADYSDADKGLVMYTGDLNKTREKLISKGLEFKGTDGSDKCLTFTDPDGNWFQLVNPADH